MQIQQARAHIMATLASGESPRADADALLCHLLDCRRSYLMTWPERTLDAAQQATLQAWLTRRLNGEPIAHLIGEREFWSLPLKV
ncbi:N5-glutamine S-adenosyl-L-methionine-dependent methyltransferase, partial [Aeromonas molluscorum 848]